MRLAFFVMGLVAGVCFMVACGSGPVFPYHYYGLSMPAECYEKGTLLGKTGKDGWRDIPLSNCLPDPKGGTELKCITVLDGDFYAGKGDYLKCQQSLSDCEKKCK